jgi:hypothetical protein
MSQQHLQKMTTDNIFDARSHSQDSALFSPDALDLICSPYHVPFAYVSHNRTHTHCI